jgi:hypothetical protein
MKFVSGDDMGTMIQESVVTPADLARNAALLPALDGDVGRAHFAPGLEQFVQVVRPEERGWLYAGGVLVNAPLEVPLEQLEAELLAETAATRISVTSRAGNAANVVAFFVR